MIRVYLDDLRDIPVSHSFIGARDYFSCIELLKNNSVEILSLDHDLGWDDNGVELKNGYDLVKWLCENYNELCLDIKNIYIHTDNPVGRESMLQTLKASQRRGFIPSNINIYHYVYVPNSYGKNLY